MSLIDRVAELIDQHIVHTEIPTTEGIDEIDIVAAIEDDYHRLLGDSILERQTQAEALRWDEDALLDARIHGSSPKRPVTWFPSLQRLRSPH